MTIKSYREAIIDASSVPIGTVPVYQALESVQGSQIGIIAPGGGYLVECTTIRVR